ncbi:MAG: VPLPA-CTERM sorting domain-containing protein [Paracoccaceae bacterium]
MFDATGRQLQIGNSPSVPGGLATLTLNNLVGTYDVTGITGLSLIGVGLNSNGALNVDGAGAFIEGDTTWFGVGDVEANVAITNGGRLSGERTFVGQDRFGETPQGDSFVLVDGAGSRLETKTISIGSSTVATNGRSEVIVSNGGTLSAEATPGEHYSYGQIYVGGTMNSLTQDDLLRVTGAGSRARRWITSASGGLAGDDRMEVLDGATATTENASIGSAPVGSATLLVSGAGSTFSAGTSVNIGYGHFSGDVTADSTTEFIFALIDGFAPVGDVSFDFLRVAGAPNIADASFGFEGFGDLATSFSSEGGVFALNVEGGGATVVPLPASGLLLLAGLGMLAAQRRKAV